MQTEDITIHDAVFQGRKDKVLQLIQIRGKHILDLIGEPDGYTPLMISCIKSDLEIANLLLEQGASVTKRSRVGNTAIFYACGVGNLLLSKLLRQHGADCHACNSNGDTALLFAVVGNHLDIVEWLLKEEHVDANVSNNLGMTALMCAAANNYYECIKLLLEHSADISKKNKLMKTALDLATGQLSRDLLTAKWEMLEQEARKASAGLIQIDKKKKKKKKKSTVVNTIKSEAQHTTQSTHTAQIEQDETEQEKYQKLQLYFSKLDPQVQDLDLHVEDFFGANLMLLSMSQLCAIEAMHYKLIQYISEVKIEKIREQERIKYEEHESLQHDLRKLKINL